MTELLALILGPLGKVLGVVVSLGGLYFWGKYQKSQKEKAQAKAEGLQAQVDIQAGREEVQHETAHAVEETRDRVEAGDAAGVSDAFNSLWDK